MVHGSDAEADEPPPPLGPLADDADDPDPDGRGGWRHA
jgi:hypothetical protein